MAAYLVDVLTRIAITSILVVSLNLAFGFTGLINLAHIAFAGIGAYTWAVVTTQLQLPGPLALAAAIGITSALALVMGAILHRTSGDQFALVTLLFAMVVTIVVLSWHDIIGVTAIGSWWPDPWPNLTRGALGIPKIQPPRMLQDRFALLVAALVGCGLTYGLAHRITRAPFGRVMNAVRDDEIAAQTLGKRTRAVKIKVLVLSSLCASLGGMLYAWLIRFIDPQTFSLNDLVVVLTALMLGGLASLPGSVLGTVIVIAILETLRFVPPGILPPAQLGPVRQIIYTGVLLVLLLYRPKGIWGKIEFE